MARSYGRIYAETWRSDDDWRALPMDAQWLYGLLVSQPDLSAAGVLPLSERRWSRYNGDADVTRVSAALDVLAAARFVVVDEDTEEVLVRTFARQETQWRNGPRVAALVSALGSIHSSRIVSALAEELRKVPELPASVADELSPEGSPKGDPRGAGQGVIHENSTSRRLQSALRKGTTEQTGDGKPETGDGNARAAVASTALAAVPTSRHPDPQTVGQRAKALTDAYAAVEPMCRWPAINGIVTKAIKCERYDDDLIRAALLRLADEGRTVTVETLRLELDGLPPSRAAPRAQSTTDQRVLDGLHLAQRLAQEGA